MDGINECMEKMNGLAVFGRSGLGLLEEPLVSIAARSGTLRRPNTVVVLAQLFSTLSGSLRWFVNWNSNEGNVKYMYTAVGDLKTALHLDYHHGNKIM